MFRYDINNSYKTGCWEQCPLNGKNHHHHHHHHTRAGKVEATMAGLLRGRLHFPMRRTRSLTVGMQVCSAPVTTQTTHATRHYCCKLRITWTQTLTYNTRRGMYFPNEFSSFEYVTGPDTDLLQIQIYRCRTNSSRYCTAYGYKLFFLVLH